MSSEKKWDLIVPVVQIHHKSSQKIIFLLRLVFTLGVLLACQTLTNVNLPKPTEPLYTSTNTLITPSKSTPLSTPTFTSTVESAVAHPYKLYLHPEDKLYVGDLISFEVIGQALPDTKATISINQPERLVLGPNKFEPFGIAGRNQATFLWVWNTDGLLAGIYTATISIKTANDDISNMTWQEVITLHSEAERNEGEWASIQTECCTIYYITKTDSERDIATLAAEADIQANSTIQQMGITFSQPLTITLLPRVLGHGGFASSEVSVSYLDRNYANNRFDILLHHEMIHILDGQLSVQEGNNYRPSIFVEGLAVYKTGGHYKPEPLTERAAALLQIEAGEWYIPLMDLANNFYASQHEIGYLEGGALVAYMIDRWGEQAFLDFYRNMQSPEDQLASTAIDIALQKHFNIKLTDLEAAFLQMLRQQKVSQEQLDDLRLTVIYYDTLRQYQQTLDPSAYFATAWLMNGNEMRKRGIVADYQRHPSKLLNITLEELLISTSDHLAIGNFALAEKILEDVQQALNEMAE